MVKVWSDFKNNTKKKWAKINRAASGTGGGPALQLPLTDLENRFMQIIGVQAATGMEVGEAGFQQNEKETAHTPLTHHAEENLQIYPLPEEPTAERWNTPGTSKQPTAAPPVIEQENVSPSIVIEELSWKPPAPKKKKKEDLAKLFVQSDKNARDYAKERDLVYERLETERLRVHEYEVRERVRQRDQELQLQAQWLEFMKEAMNVIKRYLERE